MRQIAVCFFSLSSLCRQCASRPTRKAPCARNTGGIREKFREISHTRTYTHTRKSVLPGALATAAYLDQSRRVLSLLFVHFCRRNLIRLDSIFFPSRAVGYLFTRARARACQGRTFGWNRIVGSTWSKGLARDYQLIGDRCGSGTRRDKVKQTGKFRSPFRETFRRRSI